MPDLEEINPYPEDEPKLRQAWEDGYRAGKREKPVGNVVKQRDEILKAWRDGYQTALERKPNA